MVRDFRSETISGTADVPATRGMGSLRMTFAVASTPITLPSPFQDLLEAAARALMDPDDWGDINFLQPPGEAALVSPDSVSWRVFKNPLSLFVGGVSAVILQLAEPRVRTGVWEHTSFRVNPVVRMRRTGLAAMVTVYGARSTAEPMIARVRRMHDRIAGTTPSGEVYHANDPHLLNWVQGTAAYGFLQAYHTYVRPLSLEERNRYYTEGALAARLYGATGAPASEVDLESLFRVMRDRAGALGYRIRVPCDHSQCAGIIAAAKAGAAPVGASRSGPDTSLGADDLGTQRAPSACVGSRSGPASRSLRRPPRSVIQSGGPGLSTDAPSGRLSLC